MLNGISTSVLCGLENPFGKLWSGVLVCLFINGPCQSFYRHSPTLLALSFTCHIFSASTFLLGFLCNYVPTALSYVKMENQSSMKNVQKMKNTRTSRHQQATILKLDTKCVQTFQLSTVGIKEVDYHLKSEKHQHFISRLDNSKEAMNQCHMFWKAAKKSILTQFFFSDLELVYV